MTYQSPTRDSLDLKKEIDELLARFDQSLSSYIDTSHLSQINRNITDRADVYLVEVFNEAKRVYEISDGAFDITVGPLVDAWGFGPGAKMDMSQEVVDSLMKFVGMDKISLVDERIVKAYPEMRIDVNAIAQGYSVDVVCDYLSDNARSATTWWRLAERSGPVEKVPGAMIGRWESINRLKAM